MNTNENTDELRAALTKAMLDYLQVTRTAGVALTLAEGKVIVGGEVRSVRRLLELHTEDTVSIPLIREGDTVTDESARVLHLTHERDVARKAVAASAERIAALEAENEALRKRVLPEGWRAVPAEATAEMADAGNRARHVSEEVLWVAVLADAYRAMLAAAPVPPAAELGQSWIRVDERLPAADGAVLIAFWPYGNRENERKVEQAHYTDGSFLTDDGDEFWMPSHWMPIPALPAAPTTKGGE